ncbi:uncharacterized protein CNMa [Chelonus insularis]|uniref:uncharacterized protein CNMa n=1 Tax=Chelonus insularis TaxID=460826 RepID=UPI0015893C6E|nr:uncharacterized protein LOC118067954 [Chelonus insularis]XP_034940878.1 uncharacterized protein LOC118067954 [Chelonus insularis]XP_034940879.1 uncharacterized protein LOC118067954 [Chelonus insularis]
MINGSMKKKVNTQHSCLWYTFISLFLITTNNFVFADPDRLLDQVSSESLFDDTVNSLLLQRLKEVAELKREIIEEERELVAQMEIQAMLEAKSRNHRIPSHSIPPELGIEGPEMLPIPSAIVNPGPTHSGKRTSSYMALCHFKICNMGRKRQL